MIDPIMFGHHGVGADAAHAAASAAGARRAAREADRNVSDLEERLDRLSLVCMAMWSLIQDKTKLTEADLIDGAG